ncbi:hypothetical protein IKL64_06705 [bacterium]|nr:hypothetical protein [bacterium]
MAVTPVGFNQKVYQGQQNGTVQPVQQNIPVSQPIPVGQPVQNGQQVPVAQNQPVPVGQPNAYPQNVQYPANIYPNPNINNFLPETNSYKYDILMQGIDFNKLAEEMAKGNVVVQESTVVTQQTQQGGVPQQTQVTTQTVAFTGRPSSELTNALVPSAGEKDESPLKLGPTIGTAVGLVAPFVCNKARLGKFLTKDLLVKVPVLGAGGLCVGGMAEGLVASAKKLDANKTEEAMASPVMMDVKA